MSDPATKAKLVEIANREYTGPRIVGAEIRPADWDYVFPMDDMVYDKPSMAQIAREKGVDPVELMIDMALAKDMKMFFRTPIANENQDHVLEMIKHPRSVVTFSDSGAHVSQIMDSSLQTHLLSHWVREKEALTLEEAVKQITYNTATLWGLHDRGLLREGMAADVVVFDPDTVGPDMPEVLNDLPAGARRLKADRHRYSEHCRERRDFPDKQRTQWRNRWSVIAELSNQRQLVRQPVPDVHVL